MNRHYSVLVTLLITTHFLLISNAHAQGVIEEVTIEAVQTTDEVLDDLVSGSSLSADKLADAGIENVEDVATYVPNLVLTETDTGTSIVIRGIGAGVNQGFDQSVGLFMDGVPLPRSQMARSPFLDLNSVQVLRGPQYVRDGNYSIAGSVHLLSKDSSDSFEAETDFNYVPAFDEKKLLIAMGLPITDQFGMRVALQSNKGGGFVENVTRNEDGPKKDELISRVVFNFNPIDDLSMKLKVERSSFKITGRNIEIIQSRATPDFRDPETGFFTVTVPQGPNSTVDINRQPNSNWNIQTVPPATIFQTEADNILRPQLISFDQGYKDNPNTARDESIDFYYLGESYLGIYERMYREAGATLPAGFSDTALNFKRGADADEFSDNESLNFTFNSELWLGESQLKFVASYIDYEFEELIDADFTALPILETTQGENYEQEFYRVDFKSSEDSFFIVEGGFSYLNSELEFTDVVRINVAPTLDNRIYTGGAPRDSFVASLIPLNTDSPLQTYFGQQANREDGVAAFGSAIPFRNFDQSAETMAAFLQSTISWTESLSSVIGLRYTRAKKSATRDVAFLTTDGRVITDADVDTYNDPIFGPVPTGVTAELVYRSVNSAYARWFGSQSHTNNPDKQLDDPSLEQPALSGRRRDEVILPSITLEWLVSDDLTLLASVRKANKLGGFDARSLSRPDAPIGIGLRPGTFEFEDENAITYELGSKWYLPDARGEIYVNAFLTKFEDLQTSVFDGKAGFNVINAGAAEALGIEVEGVYYVTDQFNVNYSLAWIDFQFTDFGAAPCHLDRQAEVFRVTNIPALQTAEQRAFYSENQLIPILYDLFYPLPLVGGQVSAESTGEAGNAGVPTGVNDEFPALQLYANPGNFGAFCNFDGQTNQYVAEWQSTTSFNYEIPIINVGTLKPTLDLLYNSGYHTTSTQDPDVQQDEYIQLNGRLALVSEEETWEVALTGQNLTNQKIISYANEVAFSRSQGSKTHYGFVRPPRTIGLNFRYSIY